MGELVPIYAVYAILFRDNGLDTAQISSLFVVWSVTAFVLEIPSGAWADSFSRRTLLVLAALLVAVSFGLFTVSTAYWGFAAGFVLWGASTAIVSGTYQALVYDELSRQGRESSYAGLIGVAESASMVTTFLAYLIAAPLLTLDQGSAIVGWSSVAIALVQALVAAGFPDPPTGDDDSDAEYFGMLREGIGEVTRDPVVRNAVVFVALLTGLLAFDEYLSLAADDAGATLAGVALLLALPTAGQVIGTALAGRTVAMSGRTLTSLLAVAAASLAAVPFIGVVGGFACVAVAYGAMYNVVIVADARLQDSIESNARATVTSASGFASEVIAVALFAYFATGSLWVALIPLIGGLGVPTFGLALVATRWIPRITSPR